MRKAEMEESKRRSENSRKDTNKFEICRRHNFNDRKKADLTKLIIKKAEERKRKGRPIFQHKEDKDYDNSLLGQLRDRRRGNRSSNKLYVSGIRSGKEGKCDEEIKRRVAIGKATMVGLEKLWRDKHVSIDTKESVMRSLIFPTVLYGCETWTMTEKMEKRSSHVRCEYGGRCKEYHGRRRRLMKVYAWRLE